MVKIKECVRCGGTFFEKVGKIFRCKMCDFLESREIEENLIKSGMLKKVDNINKPPHYTKGGIEPIDFSISNNLNFCEGNIIKYITRYKYKNGLEDLKKAQFYINKLIEDYDTNKDDN